MSMTTDSVCEFDHPHPEHPCGRRIEGCDCQQTPCEHSATERVRDRSATAIRFRPEVHDRLRKAAEERDLSINWLVNKAVEQFLDRLIPVDEIQWTRDSLT